MGFHTTAGRLVALLAFALPSSSARGDDLGLEVPSAFRAMLDAGETLADDI
jgi:hypothetical protein